MLYWEHLVWAWFELTTLVAIGTDWTGSWKSNYHTITTTTAPARVFVKILRTIVLIALFLITHSLFTSLNIYPKSFQSLGHFQNLQANGLENVSNWNPGTCYMYMQVFNNKKKKRDEISHTVKSVLRGHLWGKEKVSLLERWYFKRGSFHTKFSMIGQGKGDFLIQVTA